MLDMICIDDNNNNNLENIDFAVEDGTSEPPVSLLFEDFIELSAESSISSEQYRQTNPVFTRNKENVPIVYFMSYTDLNTLLSSQGNINLLDYDIISDQKKHSQ